MSLDGLCDGDCGEPAVLEIEMGGESGFFCALCAPTGPARPVPRGEPGAPPVRSSWGPYDRACQACQGRSRYLGVDDQGEDVWRCEECGTVE